MASTRLLVLSVYSYSVFVMQYCYPYAVLSVFSVNERQENLSRLTFSVTLDKIVMFCHQRGSAEEINGIQDEREIRRKKKRDRIMNKNSFYSTTIDDYH